MDEETQYLNNSKKAQEKDKGILGSLNYPVLSHSEPQGSCKTDPPIEPPVYHIQRTWRRAVLIINILINVLEHIYISGREY